MTEPVRSLVIDRLRAAGCVFAEAEADLLLSQASNPAELWPLVERRAHGTPLEYVLGWAEFCGLRILVDEGVFVPRRRTEFLVREAVALAPKEPVIVDLCCGSGAVGRALGEQLPAAELHASDIDPRAVACARRNLVKVSGEAYAGDLFYALPIRLRGDISLLVVNAPYVPHGEIDLLPAEAREYEPLVALDGGSDGLDVHRRVLAEAPRWLAPGGHLLIETSERQVDTATHLFTHHGLVPHVAHSEEYDATVVIGSKP